MEGGSVRAALSRAGLMKGWGSLGRMYWEVGLVKEERDYGEGKRTHRGLGPVGPRVFDVVWRELGRLGFEYREVGACK